MSEDLTQEEGWCAGDIDGAITMHGWDELMEARAEWLPKIGEEGWRKAFSSVGSSLCKACIAADDYEDVKAGRKPGSEIDPDSPEDSDRVLDFVKSRGAKVVVLPPE